MRDESLQFRLGRCIFLFVLIVAAAASGVRAAPEGRSGALAPALIEEIDEKVAEVLEETGVPSASIAVVHDGAIALTRAYGLARIEPPMPAGTAMRYPIGSISKQFTAAAVAMLAEEGKLSLDDTVGRYFPEVTRAGDITLRQLLSHTSGIRDYWPQDFVPPAMLEPITTPALLERFAAQPLDFEPGTQYQYSNTGYVLAGAVVEKVSGQTLFEFLRARIFAPLGMKSVVDIDQSALTEADPTGYQRFALGPAREAPQEGHGWLFAAAPLAMTAEDLARWDAAFMEGSVPGAGVVRELSREIMLDNGAGAGYGLGVSIGLEGKRRIIGHGGEVSGFTATNLIYPEERLAVDVLSNQDAARASGTIAREIAKRILSYGASARGAGVDQVRAILKGLRRGELDRSLFTDNGNHYFSETALRDIKAGLRRAGSVKEIEQTFEGPRGGFTTRVYSVKTRKKTLHVVTRAEDSGKLEQFTVAVE